MKVGVFLKNFRPEIGGGSTFESEILPSLIKYGSNSSHRFTIFSWSKGIEKVISGSHLEFIPLQQSYAGRSFKERIKYRFLKTINQVLAKLPISRQFPLEDLVEKLVINSGVEVIWYLELGTYNYLTLEIPYITTVWDLAHRQQPFFPEVSTGGRWERREKSYGVKIQRAAAVITGTSAGKAEIERFYQVPSELIHILPYPVPSFALQPSLGSDREVLAKYQIPHNYLFYPAQFWPHKNHTTLLLAVQILREVHNLIMPVVFVGADKGNKLYIEQLVNQLNLSEQVYFLGFVPQSDLSALYRQAFALTFTTFCGPDNLPPIEAFGLGCPVIASQVAGAEEQLGDAAILFDPTNEQQLAVAIKALWDAPKMRSHLIQLGLERAAELTGEHYIQGIFKILDQFAPIRRCWSSTKPFKQK